MPKRKPIAVDDEHVRNLLEQPKKLEEIPVELINEGVRIRDDRGTESMQQLKVSIKQRGLITPIAVMEYGVPFEGKEYFLLAGGRRLNAFKELREELIPARIYPPNLTPFEIRVIELEENVKRKDFSEAEHLKSIKLVHDCYVKEFGEKIGTGKNAPGHSMRDTAKLLGQSIGSTSRDIKIAEYMEVVPDLAKLGTKQDMIKAIEDMERQIKLEDKNKEFEKLYGDKKTGTVNMKKLLQESYILGDFFEEIKKIPSDSIDLVDLDPDYPIEIEAEGQHEQAVNDKKLGNYITVDKDNFPAFMSRVLKECYRVMAKDSWLILWFGYEYFQDMQDWSYDAGFRTHFYHGKWFKEVGHTRNPFDTLNHTIEPFFYFKKGNPRLHHPRLDVFKYSPIGHSKKVHPYEKPLGLMKDILSVFIPKSSNVLVPFAGSGQTLIAANSLQCRAVGFDLSKLYKDQFTLKIMEEKK